MGRDSWQGLRGVDCGFNDVRRRGAGEELPPAMRPKRREVAPPAAPPAPSAVDAASPEAPTAPESAPTEAWPALLAADDSIEVSAEEASMDPAEQADAPQVTEKTGESGRPRYGLRWLSRAPGGER
ncbi:MAG: hypothetical protein R3F60_18410 [bacterium]